MKKKSGDKKSDQLNFTYKKLAAKFWAEKSCSNRTDIDKSAE